MVKNQLDVENLVKNCLMIFYRYYKIYAMGSPGQLFFALIYFLSSKTLSNICFLTSIFLVRIIFSIYSCLTYLEALWMRMSTIGQAFLVTLNSERWAQGVGVGVGLCNRPVHIFFL